MDLGIWVEIPGDLCPFTASHMDCSNQSYFYGFPPWAITADPQAGAGLLAATLQKNFDLNVDNYVVR